MSEERNIKRSINNVQIVGTLKEVNLEYDDTVVNKNNPNVWGVSNHSKDSWRVTLPNGQKLDVPQGKGFPIYKDVQIEFSAGKIGKIE